MNRRSFIGKAALGAGAITIIPRHVMGGTGYLSPSDRISLGYIGVGKQSHGLLNSLNGPAETIVLAACDVDKQKLKLFHTAALKANEKKLNGGKQEVDIYENYRNLLERKDIDAVVIATPDHWHAMVAIDAAKSGKDIYCEKPLALTVDEGRAMVLAARKYNRVFQTGNMQRSWRNFRHACEMVSNGYLGDIKTINVNVDDPHRACELPPIETPDYLNWDLWVGPSLYRSYHPDLSPPIADTRWALWREYRGFGGGYITDWGAHMFDIAQWAMGMDNSGPLTFEAPGPNAKRGMKMTYANGTEMYHNNWGETNAVQFIGTEGKIEVNRSFYRSDINGLTEKELSHGDKPLYHSDDHYQDWIDAIKNRTKPVSDVEIGHRTSSLCNIVNIAYDLERPLKWSPNHEKFIDDNDANSLLTRPYRGKWNYKYF